jgi:uncharacterized protein (DUF1015 family)
VPTFRPFRALRYRADLALADVTAPPYDVLSTEDADALRRRHPDNIVHVDVPDPHAGDERYARAAELLARWRADGVLVADEAPTFTLYRMHFVDGAGVSRDTVGVLGALEVVDDGAGGVLPHERTTPKASTDRLDLTRATDANLSPVWALSLTAGLTDLLRPPGRPAGEVTVDEVRHSVEIVDDPDRVAAIAAAVSSQPALIADGHHRYAISRTYRDERRASGHGGGGAEATLAYVAELVDEQLTIDAIHRLYHGIEADRLALRLGGHFHLEEAGAVDESFAVGVVERGSLCLVRPDGSGVWLHPRPEAFTGVRRLDGAYLEHALAESGIEVTYQHGVSAVLAALAGGAATAAVLIRPTSIAEIRRTAHERLLMPPKSTFFTPKLRTGLVIRPLE